MAWHAQLSIDYTLEDAKTLARHQHSGPLRVLQSLYPEGPGICHNVLVHPPGGLVGGDTLDMTVRVQAGAHGLVTTPGATRFYRSEGAQAVQRTHLALEGGARLEWLPLEALCFSGCEAENHLTVALEPGAELMAWDVTALGLPHADQPFVKGRFLQHLEVPGIWLERGLLDAEDARLLDGPVGLAGKRCVASLVFVAGSPMERERREHALESVRAVIAEHPLASTAGATSPHPQVLVVRVIAPVVEPAMDLLRKLRNSWRDALWELPGTSPRIWAM